MARQDRLGALLLREGLLTEEQLQKMDAEIKAVVQDAWDFADASPELPLEALYEDVYVDTTSDSTNQAIAAD